MDNPEKRKASPIPITRPITNSSMELRIYVQSDVLAYPSVKFFIKACPIASIDGKITSELSPNSLAFATISQANKAQMTKTIFTSMLLCLLVTSLILITFYVIICQATEILRRILDELIGSHEFCHIQQFTSLNTVITVSDVL